VKSAAGAGYACTVAGMSVRAKFKVDAIKRAMSTVPKPGADGKTEWVPGEVHSIEMSPVYGKGDPAHENTKFWQASPSGSLVLGTVNQSAAEQFELGAEYYIDFTKAP
jgi:hypothetical protein